MRNMRNQEELPDLSKTHASAKDAVSHAIQWLSVLISKPSFSVKSGNLAYRTMQRDFPYVIHDTNTEGVQILVNRAYKPVGSPAPTSGPFANYEEFKNLHVKLTAAQIQSVVSVPHERGLFGDGNPPWRKKSYAKEYLERLKKLYALLR